MSETYHVVPRGDVIEHTTESTDGCACKPNVMQTVGGQVAVHYAWDGRIL